MRMLDRQSAYDRLTAGASVLSRPRFEQVVGYLERN